MDSDKKQFHTLQWLLSWFHFLCQERWPLGRNTEQVSNEYTPTRKDAVCLS